MWVLAEFLHKRTSQLHSGRSTERAKVRNLKGGTHARPHTYTRTHAHVHTHRHFWFTVRVCLSKRITVKLIGIIFQDILVQAVNDRNKYNLPNRKARRKWAIVWEQRMNTQTKRHPRPQRLYPFFLFYWFWTYFGSVDILDCEILLQGTRILGEGESIGRGLGHSGGTQQTNALREQTHLGWTTGRLQRGRKER